MTSRERVIRTLDRRPTDRMPIDLGCHYSTGISAFAYWHLRRHLGLATDHITVPDVVQFLARVDEDILERFHCDCMLLHPGWPQTARWRPRDDYEFVVPAAFQPQRNADGEWSVQQKRPDGTVARMRMPAGGFFFDGSWLSDWHECSDQEWLAATAREAERIYKETDYATIYMGFGAYFSEDPDWLCKMLTDPDELIEANRQCCRRDIEQAGRILDAMGPYIQAVCINADMGLQTGPFCRPALMEQITAPFIKQLCDFIHRHSDCKVFHHCCGSIKPLISMLIDCGVDVLNPVQISADNMDPRELKAEFGDRIVFWGGGCDTQNVLAVRSPSEVSESVRGLIDVFKPGGGFVFNQVHNIMGDVPPENIVAMLETAYEESWY